MHLQQTLLWNAETGCLIRKFPCLTSIHQRALLIYTMQHSLAMGRQAVYRFIVSQCWPQGQNFVLGLEHLSLACPPTYYFGLVKMSVMMELIIIVSLQWLSTKALHLLTLCYWY